MQMHREMTTVDVMDRRLREWAEWRVSRGTTAGAFPNKNILHPSWLPPTGPALMSLRAISCGSSRREREMDSLIGDLPVKLRDAVWVVYLLRADVGRQVELLKCKEAAVRARVVEAKRRLAAAL